MDIQGINHIAIIVSDLAAAQHFYGDILGFKQVAIHDRPAKNDTKLDLKQGNISLELFVKPNAPKRLTGATGEALGLRHLAFQVASVQATLTELRQQGVTTEPLRYDDYTGQAMAFFRDPDNLPIEIHE